MAIGLLGVLTIVSLVLSAAALVYMLTMSGPDMGMDPDSEAQVTTCSEGSVCPVVYGTAKLNGNIIAYDNFLKKKKRKHGQDIGYKYYLDVWQAICHGQVTILKMYVQDKEETIQSDSTIFNDGTGITYPAVFEGDYENAVPGIATYFWEKWYLGLNNSFVPTVHFVVKKTLPSTPLNYEQLTNGINPAAIIFLLLIDAGVSSSKINTTRFNTAAAYWNDKDYGLNIVLKKRQKIKKHIEYILSFVGGVFSKDADGKYYVKAFDPDEVSAASIITGEFLEFEFSRKSWMDTYNEFKGTFIDQDQEYTKRVVVTRNIANMNIQGRKRVLSVDLSAFLDQTDASKRLWEIMKQESYPYAVIKFRTNLTYSALEIGDIVTITNAEFGIADAEFRIIEKNIETLNKNEVGYSARQVTETLFDDVYQLAGSSQAVAWDVTPAALVKQRIFELPYTLEYGRSPVFLILAARVNSYEGGMLCYISYDAEATYDYYDSYTSFSEQGTLDAAYSVSTDYIDDDIGILFTPYKSDTEFETLSRINLFNEENFILINNEIMMFQAITAEGASYRLTGIVRGIFNTTIATHAISSEIWLFSLGDNVIEGVAASDFDIKLLPYTTDTNAVDIADAINIDVTAAQKAMTPAPVCRIEAVRSGSTITVTWWPTNQEIVGAGMMPAEVQYDQSPSAYDQDFEYYHAGATTPVTVDGITVIITYAPATTVYVRSRYSGYVSAWESVYVGASDDTYVGPVI